MNNEIPVPNKTVKYFTYDYFDVDTVGLLADCAPSVTVADIAYSFKSCKDKEINWKYRDACLFRKKGWVGQDGKTINSSLSTAFGEIDGASENIEKCLKWDGVYDDYDYWYLEEIDTMNVRNKRDLNESIPDFLKNRNERSITQKGKRKFQEKTKRNKKRRKTKRNNYGKKSNKKNSGNRKYKNEKRKKEKLRKNKVEKIRQKHRKGNSNDKRYKTGRKNNQNT